MAPTSWKWVRWEFHLWVSGIPPRHIQGSNLPLRDITDQEVVDIGGEGHDCINQQPLAVDSELPAYVDPGDESPPGVSRMSQAAADPIPQQPKDLDQQKPTRLDKPPCITESPVVASETENTSKNKLEMAMSLIVLSNLAEKRYEKLRLPEDMISAIKYRTRSIALMPPGQIYLAAETLSHLASLHQSRFEDLGETTDLDMAVRHMSQAVSLTPDGYPDKPARLSNLGVSYVSRFRRLGRVEDIDMAISCQNQAVLLTFDGHPNKPVWLHLLGYSYSNRFDRLGELPALDMAINYKSQAVSLVPERHPRKPGWLSRLGNSYWSRFQRLGQLADLDMAMVCSNRAVSLTPNGHPDKPRLLSSLGNCHWSRFQRLGKLVDLDMAVGFKNTAASLTPNEDPDKPKRLSNLAGSHWARFHRLGQLLDLDLAVDYNSQATSLTPDDHPDKPIRLNNLGTSHSSRFRLLGHVSDIDAAVKCSSEAVALTPYTHPEKPKWLHNLGNIHRIRYNHSKRLEDLDAAISCNRQAVSLTPDGHPDRPGRLSALGSSYMHQFESAGQLEDLEMAIGYKAQAVSLTPDGHPDIPEYLTGLGSSYVRRYNHSGDFADISQAIAFHRRAAQAPTGPPSVRFGAARAWASLSVQHELSSSLDVYEQVLTLVPQLAWVGSTPERRYEIINDIDDVAIEAAAHAIRMGEYNLALEWLEQGRSIVWTQRLQLRTPVDELMRVNESLAEQLNQTAFELEHASYFDLAVTESLSDKPSLEDAAQRHHRLAEQWEELVNQVRALPGMQSFLCPKKADELVAAAHTGAVVVVNLHNTTCDSLIIHPGSASVAHLALPQFTNAKAVNARTHVSAPRQRQEHIDRKIVYQPQVEDTYEDMLHMLWADITEPVLNFLGYKNKQADRELPHIAWCTTGSLSFLPLHAAGDYGVKPRTLYDCVVSSFTPTVSALLKPRANPAAFCGIVTIGQASTPELPVLPGTRAELDRISAQAGNIRLTRLDDGQATTSAVLHALDTHSWVHFACHASQNSSKPTASAFYLYDGTLDLGAIANKRLEHADLAFLSACQTAAGDEGLPEEALHLAAGIIMAGYKRVIATMWSIDDSDAPLIAENFYGYMLDELMPNENKAARALHHAVGCLRKKIGVKEFGRWAPYIHIGL